jgi:hypothetical protein
MKQDRERHWARAALLLTTLLLSACAARPYAGVHVMGPSWGYGPVRIGTGANIGIALPPIK